jgi:hypothetical protein
VPKSKIGASARFANTLKVSLQLFNGICVATRSRFIELFFSHQTDRSRAVGNAANKREPLLFSFSYTINGNYDGSLSIIENTRCQARPVQVKRPLEALKEALA